jgi:hypothetical protein
MKLFFTIIFILCTNTQLFSQNKEIQAKWQQRVNYKMNIELHPQINSISAKALINYVNNSPDTLKEIIFHCWPNAYRNNQTAFAKQELINGKKPFYYSKDSEKGSMDSLTFTANSEILSYSEYQNHADIVILKLNKPLAPNAFVDIETYFWVKVPAIFSRMGVLNSFFSITQWYPKPAVYDINGWNPIPYLDQGEFYSEFGNYEVNITLPGNYVCAATGELKTESELAFLNQNKYKPILYKKNEDKPYTLRFTQNNIHDFAWFADTAFYLDQSDLVLDNGDTVVTRIFSIEKFNGESDHPIFALNEGVKKYSEAIGRYPYKNCSVVVGPLLAGSGMEYPTITICNSFDRSTIIHEVGHNWFYGILASNERKYPWMDESINTFFHSKFDNEYKNKEQFLNKKKFKEVLGSYTPQFNQIRIACKGNMQACNISSEAYTSSNYGSVVYSRGPLLFAYLNEQLGEELFNKCVMNYYQEWKFKHPLPGDIQKSFEKTCGYSLDWFFDELLKDENNIDIKVKNDSIIVKNANKFQAYLNEKKDSIQNKKGFLLETKYTNNGQKTKLISISIPFKAPSYNVKSAHYFTPIVGFNTTDKLYVGGLLYNRTVLRKRIEYKLMPSVNLNNNNLIGFGQLNLLVLKNKRKIHLMETGLKFQRFGNNFSTPSTYQKIQPYLSLQFKKNDFSSNGIQINYFSLTNNADRFNQNLRGEYVRATFTRNYVHPIFPNKFEFNIENKHKSRATNYTKIASSLKLKVHLNKQKKYLKSRLFAGMFLNKTGDIYSQSFFASGNGSRQDYLAENALIGRGENYFDKTIFGQQLLEMNGNLRSVLPVITGENTDKWMIAINNEITMPGKIPFNVFFDMSFYPAKKVVNTNNGTEISYNNTLVYVGGISLPLIENHFEIYFPLMYSKQYDDLIKNGILNNRRIGFRLNLNALNPFDIIDNFD